MAEQSTEAPQIQNIETKDVNPFAYSLEIPRDCK